MPNCKTVVPYRGTPEQEERLRQVIAEHKGQPGATMPVLQAAQEIFGYLPEEVQIMVAEGLDIPLSEVYGVASFYAQFSMNPRGSTRSPSAWAPPATSRGRPPSSTRGAEAGASSPAPSHPTASFPWTPAAAWAPAAWPRS